MSYDTPTPPEQPEQQPPAGGYGAPPPPPPPPPPAYGGTVQPAGYGTPAPGAGYAGTPPSNWLVPAILATIFCCLPFGIVGIVFASQVNSKWSVGDVAGANEAAGKAKLWTLVSVGVSLAGLVVWVLLIAMGVASMSFSST